MKALLLVLERWWRHHVVYPALHLVMHNEAVTLPLNITEVNSILILRYDKIGDMIVTLPIVRMIKVRNPRVRLAVLASKGNAEVLRGVLDVDEVYVLHKNPVALFLELRRMYRSNYNLVLNFIFNRMTSGALITNYVCRGARSVGLGPDKYRFYFNVLLSIPRGRMHMFEMLVRFVEMVFGFQANEEEKRLYYPVDDATEKRVAAFLETKLLCKRSSDKRNRSRYVVFNISAGQEINRLSLNQITTVAEFLCRWPSFRTVVIAAPADREVLDQACGGLKAETCIPFPAEGSASLAEIASLLEGALCVVTPDTAIVHIASAVSTPLLGIFTPLQVLEEWGPYKVPHELIMAAEGQPVNTISQESLIRGTENFLKNAGMI